MPTVRITNEAAEQAQALDAWWRVNRTAAPTLFAREFASGIALLGAAPGVGELFKRSAIPGVRRLVLRKSKNIVFYLYRRDDDTVFILAVWGGPRGSDPTLASPE
jgi:plasmid stabilization system protein ParE